MGLSCEFAKCSVFFCVMISQVWAQEKTQRLKKAKFIILTGLRERGSLNAMKGYREVPDFGQVAENRVLGKLKPELLLGSSERQGRDMADSSGLGS